MTKKAEELFETDPDEEMKKLKEEIKKLKEGKDVNINLDYSDKKDITDTETQSDIEPEKEKPKKQKKPRKPLSDERKAQLREQLKRGREKSLQKRQAGAKKKKETKNFVDNDLKGELSSLKEELKLLREQKKEIPKEEKDQKVEKEDEIKILKQQMEELKLLLKKQKEDKPKIEKIPEEVQKLDDGTKVRFPKEEKQPILPKQPEVKSRFVSRGKFDYSKYFKN